MSVSTTIRVLPSGTFSQTPDRRRRPLPHRDATGIEGIPHNETESPGYATGVTARCVLQCAATVRGRLDRVEQRLARERADCDDDKARAEQRILSQVAHARVSPLLSLAYAVIALSTTGSAGRQEC